MVISIWTEPHPVVEAEGAPWVAGVFVIVATSINLNATIRRQLETSSCSSSETLRPGKQKGSVALRTGLGALLPEVSRERADDHVSQGGAMSKAAMMPPCIHGIEVLTSFGSYTLCAGESARSTNRTRPAMLCSPNSCSICC